MAKAGKCYFDGKGNMHKTPDEATKADFAAILGKIGEGDSMAPGIANILMDKRLDIERIYRDHDHMIAPCDDPIIKEVI